MEVQLHLAAGGTNRLGHPSPASPKTVLTERARGAGIRREPEEAHRPVLAVSGHPIVGRRLAGRTADASLAAVGGQIDGELILAQVFGVGQGPQLGHHLRLPFQLCPDIGCAIGAIGENRPRAEPDRLLLPLQERHHGVGIIL